MGCAGGSLRDDQGHWLGGFSMNIGTCSIMAAKLWGFFPGLSLALDLGFRHVKAEVDNASVVTLATTLDDAPGVHMGLVSGIKELLSRPWEVKVKHIP
ncbi:Polynucleotidyl transferase- ribonuclease H-like superfamily protein [Striga hermonthica]|uniref:Polynucleotidyl transferase- ribonuclease H-like superfamily protein n=1 Tax=Striga hermonthica TaxID=68872 RepID=A0A9N7NCA0_STRHE|nr:Polynucleotidyl transferase- ribonuclease H-like superfamily protein [Striga hermonthica]